MSITLQGYTINQPQNAKVVSEPNRKFGRRFELIGIAHPLDGTDSTLKLQYTMNELYKSALASYKANKNDKAALQNLRTFVVTVQTAETNAIAQYKDAGCMYNFRTFFHRFFGGSFFGTHTDRLAALTKKIDDKIDGPKQSTPVQPTEVKPPRVKAKPIEQWNYAYKFTAKVYEPLPVPKTFEGSIISNSTFDSLINTHYNILSSYTSDTHGNAFDNLRDAFKHGKGKTIGTGNLSDFVPDKVKNQQLHRKIQEIVTIISKKELKEQQELMGKLGQGFNACNTGRINKIEEMHDHLLFNNSKPDFEGRLRLKILTHKQIVFNQLILEKSSIYSVSTQFPHMSSGYLAVVGDTLGLSGTLNAGTDPHRYRVNEMEKQNFIIEFQNRFTQGLDALIIDLANEINNKDGDFHPSGQNPSFGTWWTGKYDTSVINEDFAYYDETKQYTGMNVQTDDHEDHLYFYISNNEVKHILGMLGYLQ